VGQDTAEPPRSLDGARSFGAWQGMKKAGPMSVGPGM
jgi:hypothetical protein